MGNAFSNKSNDGLSILRKKISRAQNPVRVRVKVRVWTKWLTLNFGQGIAKSDFFITTR